MLIVTPVTGSMPEPRPQQLITGDRAIAVLDTASSSALQNAGVKLATVSLQTYTELVSSLTPYVFDGLDANGVLKPQVMPTYLSQAAIASIDVLDPTTNTILTQFLPSYLTTTGLTSLIATSSSTQITSDPDGTPVVIGGTNGNTTNWAITGTLTANTVTAGVTHGDVLTGTQGTINYLESNTLIIDGGSEPAAPNAGNIKLWVDTNNRLVWKNNAATNFRVKNIQVVTSLPAANVSYIGDECIVAATGEHRIYKGASFGWRLASPLQVASVAARNALTNVYDGMRVYVSTLGQDCVWRSADNTWHGTQGYFVDGAAMTPSSGINDTNFRTVSFTNIADPGFPYTVTSHLELEIARPGTKPRVEVWSSMGDYGTGANQYTFDIWYNENNQTFARCSTSGQTVKRIGACAIIITARYLANGANGFINGYQYYNNYRVDPA